MIQEEINALNDAVTKGGDTLNNYVKGLKATEPEIKLDGVKKFLEENDEGKTYLQSTTDKRVTDGIETFKKNNLQKLVDDGVNKKYLELHPEDKPKDPIMLQLLEENKQNKAKLEQMQKETTKKDLTNKALQVMTEKKLPTDLVNFVVGENEETTKANLKILEKTFNAQVEATINGRLKGGYKPPKTDKKTSFNTLDDLKGMTQDEINAHWAEIQQSLGKK